MVLLGATPRIMPWEKVSSPCFFNGKFRLQKIIRKQLRNVKWMYSKGKEKKKGQTPFIQR